MQRVTVINGCYVTSELLGGGGMAQVFLARDEVLERGVAMKILRGQYAEDEEFVERFRREALGVASLSHPNEPEVHVHWDRKAPPEEAYSTVIYYPHDEDIVEGVRHSRHATPDAPILGFSPHADSQVARDALQVGARGFIHAQMSPEQVRYALLVAREGDGVLRWPGRQGLRFSTELSAAVDRAHALLVAVDTPQDEEEGLADLSSAAGVARALGRLEGPPADDGQQETRGDYCDTMSMVPLRVCGHRHVDNSWCHR